MRIPERRCLKYQTVVYQNGERHLFDCFISEIALFYSAPLQWRITWLQNRGAFSYKLFPDFPTIQSAFFDRLSALKSRVKRHNFDVNHTISGPNFVAARPESVMKSDIKYGFHPGFASYVTLTLSSVNGKGDTQ